MNGMPILNDEGHYVPYSQAKVGGTVRQLGSASYNRHMYCSTPDRSAQMAGIDVKETYCVSRAVQKSDESVVESGYVRGPSHGLGTGVVDLTTASGRRLARLQQ